jgi:hypothetical protein
MSETLTTRVAVATVDFSKRQDSIGGLPSP